MVITLVIVVVLLVVAAGVIGFILERRRGDHDLLARQKRHEELEIHPLDPDRVRASGRRRPGAPRGADEQEGEMTGDNPADLQRVRPSVGSDRRTF